MADILIKGMEMPKGRGTSVHLYVHSNGQVFFENGKNLNLEEREAIEIPPHGRLIDGDKLLTDHNPNENWDYMVLECIIRNAQTVVEASE